LGVRESSLELGIRLPCAFVSQSSPRPSPIRWLNVLILLIGLAGTPYFAWTYSGPYRWLAELQMWLLGSFQVVLTFALTFILLVVPAAKVLRRWGPRPTAPAEEPVAVAGSDSSTRATGPFLIWVQVITAGAVFTFLAIRDHKPVQPGATPTRVSCAELEANGPPESGWLEVEGIPLLDARVEAQHNYGEYVYVPLVSPSWSTGRPIAVVLRLDRNGPRQGDVTGYQGTRVADGMPGFVRSRYEDAGLNVAQAVVLDFGRTPADGAALARIAIIVGPLVLLAGLVGALVTSRRRAK
jgi:hypothetical protein